MIVSISQPTLFPWMGYFDIIKKSDVFVFLDTVKFEKRSWQMRNKIKKIVNNDESEMMISIPTVNVTQETKIQDVLIDNSQKWKRKHLNSFKSSYGNNATKIDFLNNLYEKNWDKLSNFNIEFIKECSDFLGIKTKFICASDLHIQGKKSNLLLNICLKLKATNYLSTIGSKEYLELDKKIFSDNKINIDYNVYSNPHYDQLGKIFIEKLSILDLLFSELENFKRFFN